MEADSGRLLLRGPNGTGKTTALEALWPYLLDLNPQRLAAGKARPTSLSSLMREGASGKRRCGYLWLTLAAPQREGKHSYGVRLLYTDGGSPAVRVVPFTVPGVPLQDVRLYGPDRGFLTADQFTEEITAAGGTVFDDEDAYISHLGRRLWVAEDREVLELASRIRAVRNPTLLGDVSPRAAADALREALPGVSDEVVAATAEALAESEATREAFRRDREAATALQRFAEAWTGHVAEVVSAAYTIAQEATATLSRAHTEQRRAGGRLITARADFATAMDEFKVLGERVRELEAALRALEESDAYKDAGRLADLQKTVEARGRAASFALESLRQTVIAANERSAALQRAIEDLTTDLDEVLTQAAAVDVHAGPDEPLLASRTVPRQPFVVGDVVVGVGPRTVVECQADRLDAMAVAWGGLAERHRIRGNDAHLALIDRREAEQAEDQATLAQERARTARATADREARSLAAAAEAARVAVVRLLDAIEVWHGEFSHLGAVVDSVRSGDEPGREEEHLAWQARETDWLRGHESAMALAEVEDMAGLIAAGGGSAVANLRHRQTLATENARSLRQDRDARRAEAEELRSGKLLPIPRPSWAGAADDGAAFAYAVEWGPQVHQALLESALAASGLLGASLVEEGVGTDAWSVYASGDPVEPNLSSVLTADAGHPRAATATEVLRRVKLVDTCSAPDGSGWS